MTRFVSSNFLRRIEDEKEKKNYINSKFQRNIVIYI